jgi:serine/threonine protein phosphatase PrpC
VVSEPPAESEARAVGETSVVGEPTATCPACGAPAVMGDHFCEQCGHEFGGETTYPCANCGAAATQIDDDGYCGECGRLQPSVTDHRELNFTAVAGVTDRGLRHARNEDAMALALLQPDRPGQPSSWAVVVCDGVSNSTNPEDASRAACDAALEVLVAAAQGQQLDAMTDATVAAAAAAQAAIEELPASQAALGTPPSCTFTSAVMVDGTVTLGQIGDCRAYWLGDETAVLTTDDSWAAEQIASGRMLRTEAEGDSRAHAITRWLGVDAPPGPPRVTTFAVPGPGHFVVCSDGLWNYYSEPAAIAAEIAAAGAEAPPLELARHLVRGALQSGGADNITVVVATAGAARNAGS